MYELLNATLDDFEIIIRRWPEYAASLEKVVVDSERAIAEALEKQFSGVLSPLKDSKISALKYVQRLTKKGASNLYSVPKELGVLLNSMKRVVDKLRLSLENRFELWNSYLPDKENRVLGEQLSEVTILLRSKYRSYTQALVEKLTENMRIQSDMRMKNIIHDLKETTAEPDVRNRMQSFKDLDVLRVLEDRKDNMTWHKGQRIAVFVLDEIFVTQIQCVLGDSLKEENLEAPRSIMEIRSMLCEDREGLQLVSERNRGFSVLYVSA